MSDTTTVSPLRQRMIEDMAARKLNPHAAQPHPKLQAVRRLAQTLAHYQSTMVPSPSTALTVWMTSC